VENEVIIDVLHAINTLTIQSYVPIDKTIVLGHSLGGMLLPKIALSESTIAGGILMAAPARPLEDLIFNQTYYLSNLDGEIDVVEQENLDYIEKQVQKIKTLNITKDEKVLNAYKAYWEYLASYNPVKTALNLSIPILILQGKRDYQVTFKDDFICWKETLRNNENASFQTYESLNHLFIQGTGIPNNEEYMIEGHVDQEVINEIYKWIQKI
jgi:esterase/lipase